MKNLLPLMAIVAFAGFASPLLAQESLPAYDGSGRLAFGGDAARACVIGSPEATGGSNAFLSARGDGTSTVTITRLVDPATAEPVASSINLGFAVICNHAHTVSLRSGGQGLRLQTAGTAGPGFASDLDYRLTLNWAGQNRQAQARTGGLLVNSPNAAAGTLNVAIETPGAGRPLVAGTYADTMIVELTPAS
jgi:hypothetical protein